MGSQNVACQELKVHGNEMRQSNQEKYLRDIVHESGKAKPNIKARKAKGYGLVANILVIVKGVPLGHWETDAGLQLCQSMLINGILLNSEAWHSATKDDLNVLEKVDESERSEYFFWTEYEYIRITTMDRI